MLQLIHVIQHLSAELFTLRNSLWVGRSFFLHLVCVSSCDWLFCFGLRGHFPLWVVVKLVHSAVVDIISVFDCQPWILFDIVAMLDGLIVDNVVLRRLFVHDSSLIHLQTALPIPRQMRGLSCCFGVFSQFPRHCSDGCGIEIKRIGLIAQCLGGAILEKAEWVSDVGRGAASRMGYYVGLE